MSRGPAPKPSNIRQRRNKKASAASLEAGVKVKTPALPNPDKRKWHSLTVRWWCHVWESPMAAEYMPTDVDGLGRVAILVDDYYREPNKNVLAEIRLQEARFGLSPVDRSRLQWETKKVKEPEHPKHVSAAYKVDPRQILEESLN
jgi:hypothetical protein